MKNTQERIMSNFRQISPKNARAKNMRFLDAVVGTISLGHDGYDYLARTDIVYNIKERARQLAKKNNYPTHYILKYKQVNFAQWLNFHVDRKYVYTGIILTED